MFAVGSSFKQQYNLAMGHDLPLAQIMIAEAFPIKFIRLRFIRDKTRFDVKDQWFLLVGAAKSIRSFVHLWCILIML